MIHDGSILACVDIVLTRGECRQTAKAKGGKENQKKETDTYLSTIVTLRRISHE
jgi:hypothetical protein